MFLFKRNCFKGDIWKSNFCAIVGSNPENMKKDNQVFVLVSLFLQSSEKNERVRFLSLRDEVRGSYSNITSLNLHVSSHGTVIVFSQVTTVYQL